MKKGLFFEAILKFLLGTVLVGVLIFLPAGSIVFLRGWILMGVLFIPMLIAGIVMIVKSPTLLEKRLKSREERGKQKGVIAISALMFLAGFVISGLNFRFSWHSLPDWITYVATGVFLVSYIFYAEVLRENEYLLRTIEVSTEQRVIDSGLYGIVRHPMYATTIPLFLSMPLILGSWLGFLVFLIYPVVIVIRIIDEEKRLEAELEGYREYKEKVRYRLIPFIW